MSIKREINEALENTIHHMRQYGLNKKIFYYQKIPEEPVKGIPSFKEQEIMQNLIKNSFDYRHIKHFLDAGDSFLKLDVTLQNVNLQKQKIGLREEVFLKSEDLGYFVLRRDLPIKELANYEGEIRKYFNR